MNTRYLWIAGMAGLGLALTPPVQAAPPFMADAFIVAERGQPDEARPDQRPDPRDARKDKRRASRDRAESEEPDGYGYGYERRQQHRLEEDNRRRGRR